MKKVFKFLKNTIDFLRILVLFFIMMHILYWISQLKSWGFSLNNLTRGGEGGTFIKGTITRSKEYKRKLSSSIV